MKCLPISLSLYLMHQIDWLTETTGISEDDFSLLFASGRSHLAEFGRYMYMQKLNNLCIHISAVHSTCRAKRGAEQKKSQTSKEE